MKIAVVMASFCLACAGQTVEIVNSGSTNTAGYSITVEKSGRAEYVSRPRRGQAPRKVQKEISRALAERLFRDVAAARPLAELPVRHCAKSVSFGTRTTVIWGGEESPDLSCGGENRRAEALAADAGAVVKVFESQGAFYNGLK
jgi:hypothetical protein